MTFISLLVYTYDQISLFSHKFIQSFIQKGAALLADPRGSVKSGRDMSKKEERERRILDAAEELLQRWGYRKVTLEDIARKAGVAKGTIYLSWKTREELFMAVIGREAASLYTDITERMKLDPEGMTLFGMVKHSMLATLKHPVMRALALQDTEFLGTLVKREFSTSVYQVLLQRYMAAMAFLRDHGLIRSDVELHEQVMMVASVSWGFLLVNPLLPGEFKLSDEQMVETTVTTLKRLLEPDIAPTDEQRREGQRVLEEYMELQIALSQQLWSEAAANS